MAGGVYPCHQESELKCTLQPSLYSLSDMAPCSQISRILETTKLSVENILFDWRLDSTNVIKLIS